ncbi:uncharacterized protein PHALS_02008 [Plasmopara halstedii]|uniref:Uncharacterized protein n=1 Tax=Plasmopara halstedii TaxID=4781 RepID=A0A0P1AVJ6_PLAHL|nr:uncharacterized protein PHALS_02008 [Plasmopara halstedii]CEG45728.1 hypothetical protein PHALS_02008 [Plasmopara halstedii]|eukprot:XP_024582097.1 hypothetical protein PHALS_02008 [Plasmopara halstedii]
MHLQLFFTQTDTDTSLFNKSKPIVSPIGLEKNVSRTGNTSEDDRRGNMYSIRSNEEERGTIGVIVGSLFAALFFMMLLACIL